MDKRLYTIQKWLFALCRLLSEYSYRHILCLFKLQLSLKPSLQIADKQWLLKNQHICNFKEPILVNPPLNLCNGNLKYKPKEISYDAKTLSHAFALILFVSKFPPIKSQIHTLLKMSLMGSDHEGILSMWVLFSSYDPQFYLQVWHGLAQFKQKKTP